MANVTQTNRLWYNAKWAQWLGGALLLAAVGAAACSAEETSPSSASGGSGTSLSPGAAAAMGGSSANLPGRTTTTPGGSATNPADQAAGAAVDVTSASGNPFVGATFFVNPDYAAEVQMSVQASPADASLLEKVKTISTAIWLDTIDKVASVDGYLDRALADEGKAKQPVVTTFVVYDLPNRDCAAKASNGELTLNAGGADKYKSSYIDAINAAFKRHPNQRIVAVIEPDSLGNLATNLNVPACADSAQGYRDLVAYALKTLAHPNVYLYLDAAHAGWLGWPDNRKKIAAIYKEVLTAAGSVDLIRGFATNVANYTVLKETPEVFDYQSNPCHDELTYAAKLSEDLATAGITNKGFLIDTSRNGHGDIRHQWGYWCNNVGAGLGERPVANPAAGIDAYVWIKPPGESDGTSDAMAPRFDAFCGYPDAAKNAPQAGKWFSSYFVELVKNAAPPF